MRMVAHEDASKTNTFATTKFLGIGVLVSVAVCLLSMKSTFGNITPRHYTFLSILLSLPMAVVAIRSLAETDYNPESALGMFAVLVCTKLIR